MATACEGHSLSFQQVRNKCHIWLNLSHLIQAFPLLLSCVSRIWHSKNGILLLSSGFAPTVPVNRHRPGWFREWSLLRIGINCAALNQIWYDFYLLLQIGFVCISMCQFCLHTKMLSASGSFRKGRCMSQHIRTIYPGSTQVRVCFEGTSLYWVCCKCVSFKRMLYGGWWLQSATAT